MKFSFRFVVLLSVVGVFVFQQALVTSVFAGVPDNDGVGAAIDISGVASVRGSLSGATIDGAEPLPINGLNRSVWYTFQAAAGGTVVANSCDSSFKNKLALYQAETPAEVTGGPINHTLDPFKVDDNCTNGQTVVAAVNAGKRYYLRVSDGEDAIKAGTFQVRFQTGATPLNDRLEQAQQIRYGQSPFKGTTAFATLGDPTEEKIDADFVPEQLSSGKPGSVWYRFRAPQSEYIRLNFIHKNGIFKGESARGFTLYSSNLAGKKGVDSVDHVEPNNADYYGKGQDQVADYQVQKGRTYFVRVYSYSIGDFDQDITGDFMLTTANSNGKNPFGVSALRPVKGQSRRSVAKKGFFYQFKCKSFCTQQPKLQAKVGQQWITVGSWYYTACPTILGENCLEQVYLSKKGRLRQIFFNKNTKLRFVSVSGFLKYDEDAYEEYKFLPVSSGKARFVIPVKLK